jgi:hypothetical protein
MVEKSKPSKVAPLDFKKIKSFTVAAPKEKLQPSDCCIYDDDDCRPIGSEICLAGQIFVCQAGGVWHNTFEDCEED